jgi:hypothetical protein
VNCCNSNLLKVKKKWQTAPKERERNQFVLSLKLALAHKRVVTLSKRVEKKEAITVFHIKLNLCNCHIVVKNETNNSNCMLLYVAHLENVIFLCQVE